MIKECKGKIVFDQMSFFSDITATCPAQAIHKHTHIHNSKVCFKLEDMITVTP